METFKRLMSAFAFLALIAFSFLSFVSVNTVEAGLGCPSHMSQSACETWHLQQTAPALRGPKKATTEPMRCESVLNDVPIALVLRKGRDNKGSKITSWRKDSLTWKQSGGGWMTSICFPKKYDVKYPDKTICGEKGHYWFTVAFTSRFNGAFCVAGVDFCG